MRLKFIKSIIPFGLVCLIWSCSPAGDKPLEEDFISAKEALIVHLVSDGLAYAGQNRNIDAMFTLEKALYLAPGQTRILASLAVIYERLELYTEALEIVEKLLPASLQLHKKQIQKIRAAASASPSPSSTPQLGTSQTNSSLEEFPYLRLSQQRARLNYRLGHTQLARKELEVLYTEALLVQQPLLASPVLRSLGVLEFMEGREDEAECLGNLEYTTVINMDTLLNAARLSMARNRLDKVQGILQPQLSLTQMDPNFWVMDAIYRYSQRNYPEVIKSLNRAIAVAGPVGTLPTDSRYIRYLAAYKYTGTPPLVVEEEMETLLEDFETQLKTETNPVTIYWPIQLIDDLAEERAKRSHG